MAPRNSIELKTKLRITSALSKTKMESKLIARHASRFLDYYADQKIDILPTDIEPVQQLIQEVRKSDSKDFGNKISVFRNKSVESRNRNLLMHLAGTVPSKTSHVNTATKPPSERKPSYETELEGLTSALKSQDFGDIEGWILADCAIEKLKLPFGIPNELQVSPDVFKVPDEALIHRLESASDRFMLLDGKFHSKLDQVCSQLAENQADLTECWPISETALLFQVTGKLRSQAIRNGTLKSEVHRRLFPDKSEEDVIRQSYLLQVKQVLEEKRENVIRDWIREKGQLQKTIEGEWTAEEKERERASLHSKSLKNQQRKCILLTAKVLQDSKVRSESQQQLLKMSESIRKEREAQQQNEVLRQNRHLEHVKHLTAQFKQERSEATMAALEREMQQLQLNDEVRKRSLRAAKPRVEYRKKAFEERRDNLKKEMEEQAREETQRREQLEATKFKVELQYNPLNVFGDTVASHMRRAEVHARLRTLAEHQDDMARLFGEMYSYTSEAVLQDKRARLEHKLRESGLIESSYARQVLEAMEPPVKPHLKTQIDLSQID